MPGCFPGTVLSQFTGFTPFAASLTELRRSCMNKPSWPGKDQTACTPVHKVNSPEKVGPDQQRSFLTHRKHVCITEMTAAPVDHHKISPRGWNVARSWYGCRRDLRFAARTARPQGQTGLPRRHTTVVGRSVRRRTTSPRVQIRSSDSANGRPMCANSPEMSQDSTNIPLKPSARGPPALSGMRFATVIHRGDTGCRPLRIPDPQGTSAREAISGRRSVCRPGYS